MSGSESDIDRARKELRPLIFGEVGVDAEQQRLEGVRRILGKYPELCRENVGVGGLPLHNAVLSEASLQILEQIVACYPEALVAKDCNDCTPLHIACCGCSHRHPFGLAVFELLTSPDVVRIRGKNEMLPLHHYCRSRGSNHLLDLQVVRLLVEAHPESVRQVDDKGNTPLHWALGYASEADIPAIRYLAEQYPEAVTKENNAGLIPLHTVFDYFQIFSLPVIHFFIETYPISARMIGHRGRTLLHMLLQESGGDDALPIARLLAEVHPDIVTMQDSNGCTPLHLACMWAKDDRLPLVRFLVELYPAALPLKDAHGKTPLGAACIYGIVESAKVIQYLVQECPEVLEPDDDSGTATPLHQFCCKSYSDLDILEILAISEKAVKAKDELGRTSLHCLSYRNRVTPESLQILVEKCPGLPSVTDSKGRLPLHLMIEGLPTMFFERLARHHTLQCLLKAFPGGVCTKDKDGKTPLELACEKDVDLTLIYELVKVNPIATLGLELGQEETSTWKRNASIPDDGLQDMKRRRSNE